jgi:hypothetical protein
VLDLWWIGFGASARNQIAAGVRAEPVHPGVIHTDLAPSVRANIVQRFNQHKRTSDFIFLSRSDGFERTRSP